MIDKALIIVIFFYAAGMMMVGMQYTLGQVFDVELISPVSGEPIESAIVGYLQIEEFNQATENIVSANFTNNSTFYD